jgi:hypothetical protein
MWFPFVASVTGPVNVVDISDPTQVSWASLAAIPVVLFMLGVLKGVRFVRSHPTPSALIISLMGAFVFGANVWAEWRLLLAQGIAVAMGAVGAQVTIQRINNGP